VVEADPRREAAHVLDEELGTRGSSPGELSVEGCDKAGVPSGIRGIEITEDGVRRKLEVVLNDHAGELLFERVPDSLG
jgi:hypothetical protein